MWPVKIIFTGLFVSLFPNQTDFANFVAPNLYIRKKS